MGSNVMSALAGRGATRHNDCTIVRGEANFTNLKKPMARSPETRWRMVEAMEDRVIAEELAMLELERANIYLAGLMETNDEATFDLLLEAFSRTLDRLCVPQARVPTTRTSTS